jgi:hypothetical protein
MQSNEKIIVLENLVLLQLAQIVQLVCGFLWQINLNVNVNVGILGVLVGAD